MFFSLKDMLPQAMQRARMTRQVEALHIVETCNDFLQILLPSGRKTDAEAISFQEGSLLIRCENASVAQFIRIRTDELCKQFSLKYPEVHIQNIHIRLGSQICDIINENGV
jgi:hypothetical protein